MMMTSQKGAELIMALMLAHATPAPAAPADHPAVSAQKPMLIAAGESSAGGPAEESIEGAFRKLSDPEKERARVLLEAQHISPGSGPAWSLDKIAAMRRSGKGWDRIVVLLQRKRLIAAGDPEDILAGPMDAPRALAEGEQLTGGIATASGPKERRGGERTVTTGLAADVSCGVPAGGTALTAAVPDDAQ